jgi:hypothetical protein
MAIHNYYVTLSDKEAKDAEVFFQELISPPHYRLRAAQQAMIERKFSVRRYPSYLLFRKDGNLVRDDAPRPELKSELINEIKTLLND